MTIAAPLRSGFRRAAIALLAIVSVASAASVAIGQTRPRAGLRERAPSASFLDVADGRVRRAWSLAVPAPGEPVSAARAFLSRYEADLALADADALERLDVRDAHGLTVVRFARRAFGGHVLGGAVVVRLRAGHVEYVALDRVDAPLSSATPRVDLDRAALAARAAVPRAERVIARAPAGLPRDGVIHPVVVVDLAGAHLHQRDRVIVDAVDGRVLAAHPRALDAMGRVYTANPVTDDDMTADVELGFLTSSQYLTGRYFRVSTCNAADRGCDPVQLATADDVGDFLYAPDEPSYDDPFAEVNAYHHANRVAAYFRDVHDFAWTCGTDEVMRVFVNYTEAPDSPYDNAAYSPSGGSECGYMLFGQGALDFSYDADVIYHEFGHAVVDGTSELGSFVVDPLGVSYEPGAINEGVADYFAATLSGDPRMAEYFEASSSGGEGALRRLDNDLVCPDDLVGEVHFDGRIVAGLAWDLREALGPEKTDALLFATVASLETTPSLADATEVLLATASALEAAGTLSADDRAEVTAKVAARGLDGCERVAPLDDGEPHLAYSGIRDLTGTAGARIAPVHYSIEVPADAQSIRIHVARLTLNGRYRLHTRVGAPVRVSPARLVSTGSVPFDDIGDAVIDRSTDPPLPRCETLYLAVETEDLAAIGASLFELTATITRSGLDEPCVEELDAGTPTADAGLADAEPGLVPGGGGCQCRATPTRDAPLGLALLTIVALAQSVARRRARSTRRDGESK